MTELGIVLAIVVVVCFLAGLIVGVLVTERYLRDVANLGHRSRALHRLEVRHGR